MDWSNEQYVRLYVRDTTTWKRLGWDGQCVLMQLLRKVDRAGTMDLGGLEPWEAIALHAGAPEESAKRGMDAILRTGTAVVRGDRLALPSFLEAQECSKSDRLRQKETRERRALEAKRDQKALSFHNEHHSSSHDVTTQPGASQPVTPGHSVLCCALPTSAVLCSAEDLPDGEPSAPGAAPKIPELESRYASGLAVEARRACAMRRRNGKMSDPVWRLTLERLAEHPVANVERAMRTFCERYADGEKDERYLLGIVRGEARASRSPPQRPGRREPARATTGADFAGAEDIKTQLEKQGIPYD